MFRAIILSVFRPNKLSENKKGLILLLKFGWIFIIIRWVCYSLIFQFRDYHGRWMPFVPPPLNLDLDTYAHIQRIISLPFGLMLMLILAMGLNIYLGIIKKQISLLILVNILGATFFLPFLVVQPIDQLIIYFIGWKLLPVTIVHTTILIWESWASVEVISQVVDVKKMEKIIGIIILSMLWILITGPLWR